MTSQEKAPFGLAKRWHPAFLRHKFLIEPRVQLTITGYIVAINLIVLFFIYYLVISGIKAVTAGLLQSTPSCASQIGEGARIELTGFYSIFWICGLLSIFVSIVGGILISHRAVGPIYRLRRILNSVEAGSPIESLVVRKHDFFSDLFPQIKRILKNRSQDSTDKVE